MSESTGRPIAVVAMGGHAFMQHGETGNIEEHERNASRICGSLMTLVERQYNIVVTHGNGPQVGNLLLQSELTQGTVPTMPLDVLVANTEGFLGYVLQQALLNHLRRRKIQRFVVTMITQVIVDRDDPAFREPTKPIGPFLSREQAEERRDRLGWKIAEDAGRGWRRLVASPRPVRVVQRAMIGDSARLGYIVVACGGGGIPIIRQLDTNDYLGVEAVVDKDLTSSVLATDVGAELLIILTDVPQVYVDFRTPSQRALGAVTIEEIESYQKAGHFASGSMGPKIEAVIAFLRAGGRRAMITNPDSLVDALEGRAGTHFVGKI